MTRNQISYNQLLEDRRSNLANERLTERRDANTYSLGTQSNREAIRHNLASEDLTRRSQAIQSSYNTGVLRQRANELAEQRRYNTGTLSLRGAELQEARRSHLASEGLTQQQLYEAARHNRASESISWSDLTERSRHNKAVESETHRSNVARETLTNRAQIQQYNLGLRNYNLDRDRLEEQTRANKESEDIRRLANAISWKELEERGRHNKVMEDQSAISTTTGAVVDLTRSLNNVADFANTIGGMFDEILPW